MLACNCDTKCIQGEETWEHGNSLVNYMKLVEIQGLTGLVKFDQWGIRNEFVLDLVELRRGGLEKVGWWQESYGIRSGFALKNKFTVTQSGLYSINREAGSAETEPRHSIENKTLVVTTIKSPPYAMFKQSPER